MTGRVWYVDYNVMLVAANRNDGNPPALADMHAVNLLWSADSEMYTWDVSDRRVCVPCARRKDPDLPGTSTVSGPGRVDLRLVVDAQARSISSRRATA
jgi:hypothetical protein